MDSARETSTFLSVSRLYRRQMDMSFYGHGDGIQQMGSMCRRREGSLLSEQKWKAIARKYETEEHEYHQVNPLLTLPATMLVELTKEIYGLPPGPRAWRNTMLDACRSLGLTIHPLCWLGMRMRRIRRTRRMREEEQTTQ
eukprot:3467897-Amphidinium_carterae.1